MKCRLFRIMIPLGHFGGFHLIVVTSILVLFTPMPFFKDPKDVHITGSTITNVEGNQIIYTGRDKRTKRAPFDLPYCDDPPQLSVNYLLPPWMLRMNGVDL